MEETNSEEKVVAASVTNPHNGNKRSFGGIILEDIDYEVIDQRTTGEYFDCILEGSLSTVGDSNSDIVSKYNDFYEQQFPDHKRTVHHAKHIIRQGKEWVINSSTINFEKLSDKEKYKYIKKHNNLVWRHNARKKYKEFLYNFVRQCALKSDRNAYLKSLPWKQRLMLNLSKKMWTENIVFEKMDDIKNHCVSYSPKPKIKMNLWRYIHKFIMKRTKVTVDGYSFLLNTAQFTEPNF